MQNMHVSYTFTHALIMTERASVDGSVGDGEGDGVAGDGGAGDEDLRLKFGTKYSRSR